MYKRDGFVGKFSWESLVYYLKMVSCPVCYSLGDIYVIGREEREGERDRDRDRQRQGQRDRDRDRQTQRHRHRQTDRYTDRHTETVTQTERHMRIFLQSNHNSRSTNVSKRTIIKFWL